MYPYMNEDAAWQRMVDLQREMENSRLWADSYASLLTRASRWLVRAWVLAGLAIQRPPRRRPVLHEQVECGVAESTSDAA